MKRPSLASMYRFLGTIVPSIRLTWEEIRQDYPKMFTAARRSIQETWQTHAWVGWGALFALFVFVGYGMKTLAHTSFTIGHEDFRLLPAEQLYGLNTLRERALDAGARLTIDAAPVYPACVAASDDIPL